jgi:hypothetical protein
MAYQPPPSLTSENDARKLFLCHRLIDAYAVSHDAVDVLLEAIATAIAPYLAEAGVTHPRSFTNSPAAQKVLTSILSPKGRTPGRTYRWSDPEEGL